MIQATKQNPLSAADPISRLKPNKGVGREENQSGFKSNLDDRLAQANVAATLAAQAQAQSQPIQKPAQQNMLEQGQETPNFALLQAKGGATERPGKEINTRMDMADYVPVTARVASSVNAASTIAGLKPWDQQWVFEGDPKPVEQDVKPLFGPSNSEVEMAELKEVLGKLNPGAAQVSESLRQAQTRGDLDIKADPAERMRMAQIAGALAGKLPKQLSPEAGAQVAAYLNSKMAAMNGNGEVSVDQTAKAGPNSRKVALVNGQLAGGSGLSGAEFMNTLSVVRPESANAQTDGESMQDDQSGTFGSRPELKVIDGAKSTRGFSAGNDFLMTSPSALHSSQMAGSQFGTQSGVVQGIPQSVVQLTGHVVPGSMAQDQLAHDAIQNMSTGIRNMSLAGGGEMRIRLKPENLGELHLRVISQGNEVGIHIQASDDKARKILQDSLGSLKDSLASQNLTLGKVAIEVAHATGSHKMGSDSQGDNSNRQASQQQFNQMLGQNAGDNRNQRGSQWSASGSDPESDTVGARPLKSAGMSSMAEGRSARARTASGRLDVMA